VTLLVTSSRALSEPGPSQLSPPTSGDNKSGFVHFSEIPRHFMVISRPCLHPDCPPRDGYIRGQYESVEFIREIPKKPKLMSSSTTDLSKIARSETRTLEQEDLLRKAERVVKGSAEVLPNGETLTPAAADGIVKEGRKRGKTISFAPTRGPSAKDETLAQDDETSIYG